MFSWLNLFQNNLKMKVLKLERKISEQNNTIDYIAHEVRTSIHGITSISQFLYENWEKINDNERRRQIAIIANNNQHITILIDQLLDLSKFSTGKMKFSFAYIDLLSCIKKVIEQFRELNINNKIEIKLINNITDKATIWGDKVRINQLLNNLLNNAFKYTAEGTIKVIIDSVKQNNKLYWRCSISDTGIGIPSSELKLIFKKFIRSSRTYKNFIGTGIGLSICQEIVKAHHGRIYAENNPDVGAKLSFLIPVDPSQEEIAITTNSKNNKDFNILLIDDENICHESIKLILSQQQKLKVISVYNGMDALDSLKNHEINLIILDVILPDISGYELYQQIRANKNLAKIPIIFQSGLANDHENLQSVLKQPKTYLLRKPYRNEELINIIEEIIN